MIVYEPLTACSTKHLDKNRFYLPRVQNNGQPAVNDRWNFRFDLSGILIRYMNVFEKFYLLM